MNGHILPVSSMAGSHRTLLNANTPTSATNVPRTFDWCKRIFESWTIDWTTLLTFDAYSPKDIRIPTFFGLYAKYNKFFFLSERFSIDIYVGVSLTC